MIIDDDRIRQKACGCRYDEPTGVFLHYCESHKWRQVKKPCKFPITEEENEDQSEPQMNPMEKEVLS